MKKIIPLLLTCAALIIFCGAQASAAEELPKKIAITYVKAPLNVPTIVERKLKIFETKFPGVELSFPELTEGPKQTAALAAGEIAFASCLGSTSAILAASEGLDLRIIGIYSRAPKAFMIVVRDPDIKSVRDLNGRKIAGPKGTILHQLLASALAKEGMAARDVEFISMDLPSAASALANGSVSAALLAGPAAAGALKNGARMLKNGEGLVDATIVIATTDKFISRYPAAAARFAEAHKATLEWIKANPDEAKRFTQQETGLSSADVETMYNWYDFEMQIKKSDVEELRRTQEFMIENGLQRNRIDIESILTGMAL